MILKKSGIYKITSPSGRFYIGSTVDLYSRWCGHRGSLRRGNHHCSALQRAANKYGVDALMFEIMALVERTDLRAVEQRAIIAYQPEYNSTQSTKEPLSDLWKQPEFREKVTKQASEQAKQLWLRNDGFRERQKIAAGRALSALHKNPDFASAQRDRAIAKLKTMNSPEVKQKAAEARRQRYLRDAEARERRSEIGRKNIMHAQAALDEGHREKARERMRAMRADPNCRARNKAGQRAARGRPCVCLTNGMQFEVLSDASVWIGLSAKNSKTIRKACDKGIEAYGHHWAWLPKGGTNGDQT